MDLHAGGRLKGLRVFWVWGVRVWGLGFDAGLGFRACGSGFKVDGLGFRVCRLAGCPS